MKYIPVLALGLLLGYAADDLRAWAAGEPVYKYNCKCSMPVATLPNNKPVQ